jgi:hypothetical protein
LGLAGRFGAAEAASMGPVRFMLTVIALARTMGIVVSMPCRMRRRASLLRASAPACAVGVKPAKTDLAVVSPESFMAAPFSPPPGIAFCGSRSKLSQLIITVNHWGE